MGLPIVLLNAPTQAYLNSDVADAMRCVPGAGRELGPAELVSGDGPTC